MEVSHVRNRLQRALDAAKERTARRRQQHAEAERTYQVFLDEVAAPLVRQLANALKVEGQSFTVFTPGGGVRLASDRGRDDYIELALDNASDPPQVVGRVRHARGSRTLEHERPVKAGASPDAITDDDLLTFLLTELEPWLER